MEVFQSGGTTKIHLLEVSKKKGELVIINRFLTDDLSILAQKAKKTIPLYLVYNTEGVITKRTHAGSTLKDRAAVENLFPGLNFGNFYYQIVDLNPSSFISVCKKQELDALVDKIKSHKLALAGISLGTSVLVSIWDHVQDHTLYTNADLIRKEGNDIGGVIISKNTDPIQQTYTINGLIVANTDLLGFSGVVSFLSGNHGQESNFKETIEALENSFVSNRTFSVLLRVFISAILGILLVNFLIFNHYFEKTERIKTSLALDTENKKNLTLLREKVGEKERKVDAIISFSNSRTSFYLDRLALSTPESILFSEVQYSPLQMPIQTSKPILLYDNVILVLGSSSNSEDFSTWITGLETLDWVKKVETMDYDYKNNNSSEFKVQISVEDPKK